MVEGVDVHGVPLSVKVDGPTLVVAIKPACDGCRDFVFSDLSELAGVRVIVVSATPGVGDEWDGARQPVLVAPELLNELDVRWPPFYVLLDHPGPHVLTEGVVFAPSQVAQEIAPFLA